MDESDPATVPEALRGHFRLATLDRVSWGLFLPRRDGLSELEAWHRELIALREVMPKHAVFTHVTGARLRGWRLPRLQGTVPVFAAVREGDRSPRRHGLICSRLRRDPPHLKGVVARPTLDDDGLPRPGLLETDAPAEILLRAARDLGTLDLVIMIDSARRLGDLEPGDLDAVLGSGRPGVNLLRGAWQLSDPRTESVPESLLHCFLRCLGVKVEPQVALADEDGVQFGRGDFGVEGTSLVYEYDGAEHRTARRQTADLRRERRMGANYIRKAWTLDELLNHPAVVAHEIDRDLGRPHRPDDVRAWKHLVDNSQYGEIGRRRTMNRWWRNSGLDDWSRTA
ncbi:hypothetical protein [Nocardioides acrostichi]|uniref:DUF559 domain-containing protein n=1 Tax=Nocardioides acrostichi TaxID=2784339 RepID=A0A930YE26_9ACTN|nr:hypothetical protein [Nocardioides acrostichi]MBF4163074.1 hypothetical protein [Nocardioides acrostichi]